MKALSSAGVAGGQSAALEALWLRSQIEAVMLRFGRALDLGDWKSYRSCFADRFKVNFERLTGQPEVYVDADLLQKAGETLK